jgi:hypothetical protein
MVLADNLALARKDTKWWIQNGIQDGCQNLKYFGFVESGPQNCFK